jgi:pimeloyl-ACP methyl ester carboxylesterase
VGAVLFEDGQHPRILQAQREALTGTDLEKLEQMAARMSPPENPRSEMDFVQTSLEQALECGPMPQVPFVVLTAGDRSRIAPPIFTPEGMQTLIELGLELQKELVALIPGGRHVVVEDSGHIIHRDKPGVFLSELLALVEKVRDGS